MTTGGLSEARLGRIHGALAGQVERGAVAVLMLQRLYDAVVTEIHADFGTLVYQAIDD